MDVPFAVYLPYLLLTLVLETPVVLAFLVRRCGWLRSVLGALAASSITHPLLWFVWPRVVSWRDHYAWYVASGELLVVLIEAVVFVSIALPKTGSPTRRIRSALGVSLVANLVSFGVGMLMARQGWLQAYVDTVSGWIAARIGAS